MKLAIIADSHGALDRLEKVFQRLSQKKITKVLHLGDFLVEGVCEVFERYPDIFFWIARGNADVNEDLAQKIQDLSHVLMQEVIEINLEGVRIVSSHIPGVAEKKERPKEGDLFCHGHTHRPQIQKKDGVIFLNPGALCEEGKYFLLELPSLKLERVSFLV